MNEKIQYLVVEDFNLRYSFPSTKGCSLTPYREFIHLIENFLFQKIKISAYLNQASMIITDNQQKFVMAIHWFLFEFVVTSIWEILLHCSCLLIFFPKLWLSHVVEATVAIASGTRKNMTGTQCYLLFVLYNIPTFL